MNPRFGPAHFYGLLALGGALVLIGLSSAHFMEEHGHVVTADGRRLFLGDQIDGLRLTAIDSGKVTFEG